MLLGLLSLVFMVIKVSGLGDMATGKGYHVTATFADIGGLRVRAPVTVSGVKIGEVSRIELKPDDLAAKVTLLIRTNDPIPYDDVSARILTEGLIGSNYISIIPGFDDDTSREHPYLREGDTIEKTQEAVILENLIGQLLFNINKK